LIDRDELLPAHEQVAVRQPLGDGDRDAPSSRLLWLESAWPSNVVSLESSLFKIGVPPDVIGLPANVGIPVSTLLPRAVEVLDSFDALVRSTSRIVRMSPMARARKSMNRSKLPAGL
jgi:hypothetical protein